MKKLLLISLLLAGCASTSTLQRAKLISVTNLIDSGKYSEAKEVVDEMTANSESAKWAKTWYLKGHLCQTAYTEGLKKNDKGLTELYPNQLSEAYSSYQKALRMGRSSKLERLIASRYSFLANLMQEQGERKFVDKQYNEATSLFEQAMAISQSKLLSAKRDLNSQFNAGLAAFEGKEWEIAIKHFQPLHKSQYSSNTTHLLFAAHLNQNDSIAAQRVLTEGVEMYNFPEDLVLLLTDLLYRRKEYGPMQQVLITAISKNPSNLMLNYTLGLAYQKQEQYQKAIETYNEAHKISPSQLQTLVNLATCHYNLGVEAFERSRIANNSNIVKEERSRSEAAFETAREWLNRSKELDTDNVSILLIINDLDRALRLVERNR